ncbi:branched-chain amino acid transaminase [Pseudidiomarina sediminum]|uniref:Branched-chain-amino-acid aminotransferase n=1 Tax=Pseudidiomarina sediminum TaxID=431675 RepID=A0A432ZAF1_9GAMM|nr:branched-chain amino acid transaminase [Pseudidiomarina sediminum]RUO74933.1 branched-chain amino acid transaminase [Pseudidiomarina sediminum]
MKSVAETIWHNGALMPWQAAQTHVMSHAVHYGTSVFEGIRVYDTPNGSMGFRLKEHIERLFASSKIYRFEHDFSAAQLIQGCSDVVRANGLTSAYLRPVVFIGEVGLGIHPPADTRCEVSIAAFEWGAYLGEDSLAQGVDVCVSSWNRLAANTMPTGAKAGGNYLSSLLITSEARRNGFHEGIALDTNGFISEGAGANLFVVRGQTLYTPPLTSSILPGITRDTVIKLAQAQGFTVREENLAREALYLADEVFMTGTAAEIVPVRSVDRLPVGAGQRGPITAALQQAFFGLFDGSTADTFGWLEPLSQ